VFLFCLNDRRKILQESVGKPLGWQRVCLVFAEHALELADIGIPVAQNHPMNTETLRAFVAAATLRNLTLAGDELHLSQPAISKQLKALEQELGVSLYERNGHGIKVTPAGELLLKKAKALVEQVEQLPKLFSECHGRAFTESQPLRVAASIMLSTIVLPDLLARFQKSHDEEEIELMTRRPKRVEALVLCARAEIGFNTHKPLSGKLQWQCFRREKLVFFAAPSHRLAKLRRVTVAKLQAERIITRANVLKLAEMNPALKQLAENGSNLKIAPRFNSPVAMKAAVARKMGIGLAFADTVRDEVRNGEFKILRGHGLKLEGMSYILLRKDRDLSPLARDFLKLARRARKRRALQDLKNR
jgi:DNA-binding transcriptional LysR family regulator